MFTLVQVSFALAIGITLTFARKSGYSQPSNVDQNAFWLGTFHFNVTTDPQTNWNDVYASLDAPLWFSGESYTVQLSRAGHETYYFTEVGSPSNFVLQDMYFQIGVENTTSKPDNVTKTYFVTVPDDHTLHMRFIEEVTNRHSYSTVKFDRAYQGYTLTEHVEWKGTHISTRHYKKIKTPPKKPAKKPVKKPTLHYR